MDLSQKLHQVMQRDVEENIVAGVSVLVEKDGKEICYCQEGMADREKGRAMSRDTIFRLYSQTKPVTAAAAMILMERGMLDLCQPVSDFFPAYREQKIWRNGRAEERNLEEREMMVLDLLRMTSGLVYPDEVTKEGQRTGEVFRQIDSRMDTKQEMTTCEVAQALAACPLAYAPGQGWRYGTSADVLGAVIETVSGMKFGEFLKKEIFEPLGMHDTAFWVPEEKRERLAAPYESVADENGHRQLLRYTGSHLSVRNDMAKEPAFASGGAGLASTLDDYRKFAAMLLQGGSLGSVRILQPQTVEYLTDRQLLDHQQKAFGSWVGLDGYTYGNLMRICQNPARTGLLARVGEYGWDGWLGCYFANFPGENMTILMGIQKKDGGTFALTRKLRNVILSSL